ncbi:DUF2207 family protein [Patescibacteria group bacterium]
MFSNIKKILFISAVLFTAIFVFSFASQAQAKSWYFEAWDVDIRVQESGIFTVSETHTMNFDGDFSWVIRDISKQRLREIRNIQVFDEETGDRVPASALEITEYSDVVEVKVNFSASNETRAFTFQYDVVGGIGFYEDHQELYWNAISSDRDVSIDDVSVRVTIPAGATESALLTTLYTEASDSTQEVVDTKTFFFTGEDLAPYTDFTIVAGWPQGILNNPGFMRVETEPTGATIYLNGRDSGFVSNDALEVGVDIAPGNHIVRLERKWHKTEELRVEVKKGEVAPVIVDLRPTIWFYLVYGGAVIFFLHPFLLFGWLLYRWNKKGKDAPGRTTIVPEYDPPKGMAPATMGVVLEEKYKPHFTAATLVDLAVRGYLKIKELEKGKIFKGKDYQFIKSEPTRKSFGDRELNAYEKELLGGIFQSSDEPKVSALKNKLATEVRSIQKKIYTNVVKDGFFVKNPDSVRKAYYGVGSTLISLGFVGMFFLFIGAPLIVDGILVIIFGRFAPKRTEKGKLAEEHARGFYDYLHTAERFRLQDLTPETFQKFLPYAMIFEIEDEWAKRFKDMAMEQPDWYQGQGTFNSMMLANSLASLNTQTVQAATPVSKSGGSSGWSSGSSGSGFSGGFSGGGGGGGGSSAG